MPGTEKLVILHSFNVLSNFTISDCLYSKTLFVCIIESCNILHSLFSMADSGLCKCFFALHGSEYLLQRRSQCALLSSFHVIFGIDLLQGLNRHWKYESPFLFSPYRGDIMLFCLFCQCCRLQSLSSKLVPLLRK